MEIAFQRCHHIVARSVQAAAAYQSRPHQVRQTVIRQDLHHRGCAFGPHRRRPHQCHLSSQHVYQLWKASQPKTHDPFADFRQLAPFSRFRLHNSVTAETEPREWRQVPASDGLRFKRLAAADADQEREKQDRRPRDYERP